MTICRCPVYNTFASAGASGHWPMQNSAFECLLDAAQYANFKAKLISLIDPDVDSLRFYQLGNTYKTKVEHVGNTPQWPQDGTLIV